VIMPDADVLVDALPEDFWCTYVSIRCSMDSFEEKDAVRVRAFANRYRKHAQYAFALFMSQAAGWTGVPDMTKYAYRQIRNEGPMCVFAQDEAVDTYGVATRNK
jgi:hypothetical protein